MAKTPQTRLRECLNQIATYPGGSTHAAHIEFMAERVIPAARTNISLDVGISKMKLGSPGSAKRQLVRTILLVECCRAADANVTAQRRQQLLARTDVQLQQDLTALLAVDNEPADGPIYVSQGHGYLIPQNQPVNWDVRDAESGYFHYACHLDRAVIVFGPENPRSKRCGVGFPPYTASGHGKRAWELNRHFAVGNTDGDVIAGSGTVPRYVAGFVTSFNPLTFTDESGHFYDNFPRLPHYANEKKFVAILQTLNRHARFVHYGACPSGKACPGHEDPATYPDA